jgi:hypothetical protein
MAGLFDHLTLLLQGELGGEVRVHEHGLSPACPEWP